MNITIFRFVCLVYLICIPFSVMVTVFGLIGLESNMGTDLTLEQMTYQFMVNISVINSLSLVYSSFIGLPVSFVSHFNVKDLHSKIIIYLPFITGLILIIFFSLI